MVAERGYPYGGPHPLTIPMDIHTDIRADSPSNYPYYGQFNQGGWNCASGRYRLPLSVLIVASLNSRREVSGMRPNDNIIGHTRLDALCVAAISLRSLVRQNIEYQKRKIKTFIKG